MVVALLGSVAVRPSAVAAAARPLPARSRRLAPVPATAQEQQRAGNGKHSRSSRLTDPAKLEGSSTATVPVQDRGGALSLDAYMRLPTEQYNELDPAMIQSLGGSSFLLKVPRVSLFNVWVEPEVEIHVQMGDCGQAVVFESGSCTLKGSELLQSLELDKRFVLYFHTVLTWQPSSSSSGSSSSGSGSSGNGSSPAAVAAAAARPPGHGSITATADVQVWSEVVGPFAFIPRSTLQGTGNAVMGALMTTMLPVFMRKLSDDYVRWAGDAAYRARRAAASRPAALTAPH